MIDIDHLKSVNDVYGHLAGDQVLKELARFLEYETRKSDIVCRYGGEEFVVVLPGAALDVAQRKAEQWRQAFQAIRLVYKETPLSATLSAGVAAYPEHGSTGDEVLRRADQALYAAKHGGRNQVVVWSERL